MVVAQTVNAYVTCRTPEIMDTRVHPRSSESYFCEYYQYGKKTQNKQSTQYEIVREPLELIHMDLCGPMWGKSSGGDRYFITIIHDVTRLVWAYSFKKKDEALKTFTR